MSVEAIKERLNALPEGKNRQLLEAIAGMSVLELAALKSAFEEVFDVKAAAAPVMMAGVMPGAGGGGAAAAEEKTEFDVILKSVPSDKNIPVIKVVREVTGLGLKEAKDLVVGAPKPVKTGIAKAEAEKLKKQLEDAGAAVELK